MTLLTHADRPVIDPTLLDTVRRIGREVLAPNAADVDRNARFPREAIEALKAAKLLSALVPKSLGGMELSIGEVSEICMILGQHCSASSMIFAMHHIQLACIVRHRADSSALDDYLRSLVEHQWLIASVTSEVGIGGDTRSSICAVVIEGDRFKLDKKSTAISYGAYADDLLVTCRRSPDAGSSDQVMVLLRKGDFTLEQTGNWDTLGMRGTCSPGFNLTSSGPITQIVPGSYGDMSSQTMVPFSHVLWAGLWLGIATDAVNRAARFVRAAARRTPGTIPPMATRLAELSIKLQSMRANVNDVTLTCTELQYSPDGNEAMLSMAFALKMNNLKIYCSSMMVEIVHDALQIIGILGYKNDSEYSVARQLRDAHSASLMVGNDRILAKNASLLLVHKEL
jgi:acyl-CoA dehydrogenase